MPASVQTQTAFAGAVRADGKADPGVSLRPGGTARHPGCGGGDRRGSRGVAGKRLRVLRFVPDAPLQQADYNLEILLACAEHQGAGGLTPPAVGADRPASIPGTLVLANSSRRRRNGPPTGTPWRAVLLGRFYRAVDGHAHDALVVLTGDDQRVRATADLAGAFVSTAAWASKCSPATPGSTRRQAPRWPSPVPGLSSPTSSWCTTPDCWGRVKCARRRRASGRTSGRDPRAGRGDACLDFAPGDLGNLTELIWAQVGPAGTIWGTPTRWPTTGLSGTLTLPA